jgi:molybdate transport system substrate-binding protein
MPRCVLVLAGVVSMMLVGALAGCGPGATAPSITVFAAASLKPAFTEIAERFETNNPGAVVDFDFGATPELTTQPAEGAAADVFASASTTQMDTVSEAGLLAGKPVPFAANTLVIVTAAGNPKKVESFADLARPGLAVAVCRQPVPCGAATHRVEDNAHVRITPVSEEPDVTDVLNKVTNGQADAGVVYRTDAISAGDKVTAVTFHEAAGVVNTYAIAVLKTAAQGGLAQRFVDMVTGERGQKILRRAGFQAGSAKP